MIKACLSSLEILLRSAFIPTTILSEVTCNFVTVAITWASASVDLGFVHEG